MSKTKTTFYCQNCGFQSAKWLGKCTSCGSWNSFAEEVIQKTTNPRDLIQPKSANKAIPLNEVKFDEQPRISSKDNELDRVLGGGIVPGSVVLLGGEPGIGKSTLLLQTALKLRNKKVMYVSGEESESQIKLRADRTALNSSNCYILTETSVENILFQLEENQPGLVIIDSVQTLYTAYIDSTPGSVSQIRESTAQFIKYAKTTGVPVILVGHITKEGTIAGPKILEHMVDVVLQFEGDRNHIFRILRSIKNRFGSTSEIGIYEMKEFGLSEVANPSGILISEKDLNLSGTAVCATMEGMRPLLIEVQALVSTAVYGMPQRSSNGFDLRRLNMLLAVLEKRCGFHLSSKDVFLNITGGIKVDDPAIDLAIVSAILSSSEDLALSQEFCFAGEIGLTGEIRPVNRLEQRISEAQKLGFSRIYVSKFNLKGINLKGFNIEIVGLAKADELIRKLF
jgi:DNA repair protein RadA/Sms